MNLTLQRLYSVMGLQTLFDCPRAMLGAYLSAVVAWCGIYRLILSFSQCRNRIIFDLTEEKEASGGGLFL